MEQFLLNPLVKPIKLSDYNMHKFDFNTSKCLFSSYNALDKDYKCLHPNGKVYISKHEFFYETIFAYISVFLNPTSQSISTNNVYLFPVLNK